MAADDILLDTEDRMDKAIQHLKQQPVGHSHRAGQSGPRRFAEGRGLRLADADEAARQRRRAGAAADS